MPDDAIATIQALGVLKAPPSADFVVWCGDREVLKRKRVAPEL